MRRRRTTWAIVILALIAAGGIAWWVFYPKPTEEDRIRALIAGLERGIEAKAPSRVMAYFSEDYRDGSGIQRKALSVLVLRILRSDGDFEVTIRQTRIAVAGREATAILEGEATLTAGPQAVGRYFGTVTLTLRKEGRDWKIVSTDGWQQRVLQEAAGAA